MSQAMLTQRTLVLNRNWMPLCTIPVRSALVLIFRDAAQVICPESYESFELDAWLERSRRSPRADQVIRTPSLDVHVPEVIKLSFKGMPRRVVPFTRRNLQRRDSNTCQYCGTDRSQGRLTIDHVVPRSRGGPSNWANCVLACARCNTRKANKSLQESGFTLRSVPRQPAWDPLSEICEGGIPQAWKNFVGPRWG